MSLKLVFLLMHQHIMPNFEPFCIPLELLLKLLPSEPQTILIFQYRHITPFFSVLLILILPLLKCLKYSISGNNMLGAWLPHFLKVFQGKFCIVNFLFKFIVVPFDIPDHILHFFSSGHELQLHYCQRWLSIFPILY